MVSTDTDMSTYLVQKNRVKLLSRKAAAIRRNRSPILMPFSHIRFLICAPLTGKITDGKSLFQFMDTKCIMYSLVCSLNEHIWRIWEGIKSVTEN